MEIYGKMVLVVKMSSNKKNLEEKTILRSKIAYNIRKYRKEKKYTQEELAEFADISYDFMRRIETTNGKCGLSIFTLYKIALALDVKIDDLVKLDREDVPQE